MCVWNLTSLQDASEEQDRELSSLRQKLSAMEMDSRKRITNLENELRDALSAAAATSGLLSCLCCFSHVFLEYVIVETFSVNQ